MIDESIHTLVVSSNRGRYALDEPEGASISSGYPLAVQLGGHWIEGRVEHSNHPISKYRDSDGMYSMTGPGECIGYYFIANGGGGICGLCVGMQVKSLREM